MKRCLLWVLLGCAVPALARTGIVQTQDGTTYLGSIRLEPDRLVVANPDREEIFPVDAATLQRASFEREPREPSVPVAGQPWTRLPAPWGESGIAGVSGATEWRGGMFRFGVTGNADSGRVERFVYQAAGNENEVLMRVLAISEEDTVAVGVTLRETLQPDSRLVFLGVTGVGHGVLQWRDQTGSPLRSVPLASMSPPYWIRLKGEGEWISAYRSSSGQRWQLIDKLELALGVNGLVGLSVVGGDRRRALNAPNAPGRVSSGTGLVDNVRIGRSLPMTSFVPQARLRSGSVVAGAMQATGGQQISFPGPLPRPKLRVEDVTSLQFQWLSANALDGIESGRSGVFLTNGEFVEGTFKGLEGNRLRISSVLFGLKSFDLNSEVMALVMGPALEVSTPYEVSTADGSRWRASALEIGEHEIFIREPTLGRLRIPAHNLLEIRRNSP